MTHGSIIGYDINAKMCQISYYNEKTQEPETVDTGIEKENNQIPLVMNYYKETWTYGRQEAYLPSSSKRWIRNRRKY